MATSYAGLFIMPGQYSEAIEAMGGPAGIIRVRFESPIDPFVRKHLLGLDHAVVRVKDLDRAAADFGRLGFTVTPRGRHTLGTENHCLMFGFDYLELLWVPPGIAPPFYADFPVDGEGMTGLALKTDHAESVHAAWARADL